MDPCYYYSIVNGYALYYKGISGGLLSGLRKELLISFKISCILYLEVNRFFHPFFLHSEDNSRRLTIMKSRSRRTTSGFTRYPKSSVILYNGVTILHYILGSFGIMIAYHFAWLAFATSILYFAFALVQMYFLMPLLVCRNCVYYELRNALCISGLNVIARSVAKTGSVAQFAERSKGFWCHNNLYLAAKVIPLLVMLPGLIFNFSAWTLIVYLAIIGLIAYRILIIFPRIACNHCRAKNICPNAKALRI